MDTKPIGGIQIAWVYKVRGLGWSVALHSSVSLGDYNAGFLFLLKNNTQCVY